jgi:hypothetical protein
MSENQSEEIMAALEPVEEPKPKRTAKKTIPKADNQTMRARAIVLGRLKNR